MWFLSYASGQTDRQTDKQTYSSQYFAPYPGGGGDKVTKYKNKGSDPVYRRNNGRRRDCRVPVKQL